MPGLTHDLERSGLPATVRSEGEKVFIDYAPMATGTGYVSPSVMLEFGARSTGEPSERRSIGCDAAAYLPELEFPTATPQVMRAERTFIASSWRAYMAQGPTVHERLQNAYDAALTAEGANAPVNSDPTAPASGRPAMPNSALPMEPAPSASAIALSRDAKAQAGKNGFKIYPVAARNRYGPDHVQ